MSFKQSLIDLKSALNTIQVTNLDGITDTMFVAMFNNQPERSKSEGFTYKKPACFIEPLFSEGQHIGAKAISYGIRFKILIEHQQFNVEGSLDENLDVYDLKDKVHRKLNGLKISNCSPLFQTSRVIDVNHGNTYLTVLEYSTDFVDITGTIYDASNINILTQTLENPHLDVVDVITNQITDESESSPTHRIDLLDSITRVQTFIGNDTRELNVTLKNVMYYIDGVSSPTYTIDWGDGSSEPILVNQNINHVYNKDFKGYIEISSSSGARVQLAIETDLSGNVIYNMSLLEQLLSYDLDAIFGSEYPVELTLNATIPSSSFTDYNIIDSDNYKYKHVSNLLLPDTTSLRLKSDSNSFTSTYIVHETSLQSISIINIISI